MGKPPCRDVHLRVYIDEPADLLRRLASIETALTYMMQILSKEDTVTQPDPNQPNPVDDGDGQVPAEPTPAR
jgi:hypothetical protein